MSKTFAPSARTPAVLTANNLLDGLSVWMSARGWTTRSTSPWCRT